LQKKNARTLSNHEVNDLRSKSAIAMQREGEHEAAAEIHLELGDWGRLTELIISFALDLFSAGRVTALYRYIYALPNEISNSEPWIIYWTGVLLAYTHIDQSLDCFENSLRIFSENNDAVGAYFSWYGGISSLAASFQNIDATSTWLDHYETLNQKWPTPPSELEEGSIETVLASTYFFVGANANVRDFYFNKLSEKIHTTQDRVLKVKMLTAYVMALMMYGLTEKDLQLVNMLEKEYLSCTQLPLVFIPACYALFGATATRHDYQAMLTLLNQAEEVANKHGIKMFDIGFCLNRI
jgi:hypothetical protein